MQAEIGEAAATKEYLGPRKAGGGQEPFTLRGSMAFMLDI